MLNPAELAHIKLDDARNQYNRAFWGMATDRESRMRFYQKRIDYWAAVRSSLEEQLQICVCSVQLFVTDAHDADRISIPPRPTWSPPNGSNRVILHRK